MSLKLQFVFFNSLEKFNCQGTTAIIFYIADSEKPLGEINKVKYRNCWKEDS